MTLHRGIGFLAMGIVLATMATACGSSADKLALSEVPTVVPEAMCAYLYRCCTDQELANAQNFTSEEQCRSKGAELLNPAILLWKDSDANQRAAWDEEAAASCLAEFKKQGCSGSFNAQQFFDQCEGLWTPLRKLGESCNENVIECVEGHVCKDNTCQAFTVLTENAACVPNPQGVATEACNATTLYCDDATSICLAKKAEAADCAKNKECAVGLMCDGANKCAKPAATCTGRN